MTEKVFIYKGFERFWHWMQSILILFLTFTGFEIHNSIHFFGFEKAVKYHNIAAWAFIILIVFAIFWHLTTGEWKQYVPTTKNLKAMIAFYITGIFKNAPHPTKKTVLSKLNPLQRIVYFGLKALIIPVMVVSGLLYMFYRYPQEEKIITLQIEGLRTIAIIHTIGAILLVVFIIAHLYLITTGHTVTSNIKAMLTGYEELETEDETKEVNESVKTA